MQQIIHPTSPTNTWQTGRRQYQVRKLYSIFLTCYPEAYTLEHLPLETARRSPLWQLKELCQTLFAVTDQTEGCGHHLNWAIHAIVHGIKKLSENLKMQEFHTTNNHADAGHQAFMETIHTEVQTQLKALAPLFDNTKHLMGLMLEEHSSNPLLLRLLIEEEALAQNLWGQTTVELFSRMFPYQPEAGYNQAGKSYFMGQWLEQALGAYEKSLEINSTLSESRRQTYLIRAMIKDRDGTKEPPAKHYLPKNYTILKEV